MKNALYIPLLLVLAFGYTYISEHSSTELYKNYRRSPASSVQVHRENKFGCDENLYNQNPHYQNRNCD